MTGLENLELLIEKSSGVITTKLADSHNIHREYLNEFIKLGKLELAIFLIWKSHIQNKNRRNESAEDV